MLSEPQSLLLDFLSSSRPVTQERVKSLNGSDWEEISRMAREHRLEPMLHTLVQSRNIHQHIPIDVSSRWADAYRNYAIKSLQSKRLLMDVSSILSGASIPFLALKGAWLTWNVYPDPALRPLRDIDIMVSENNAVRAFELLRKKDFKQQLDLSTPLEFTIKNYKHMPGLMCPKSGKKLEVHVRLIPETKGRTRPSELLDFGSLYKRRIEPNRTNSEFSFPNQTVSLLHIVVHAVEDHLFNNGPLFVEDIRRILLSERIDWQKFWDLAAVGKWTKGCELAFDLVEFYHGEQKIDWRESKRGQTPRTVIDAVSSLMLQRLDAKSNIQRAAKTPSVSGRGTKLFAVFRWIFLRHFTLANVGNLAQTSLSAYLNYPRWVIRNLRDYQWRNESQVENDLAVSTVTNWLAKTAD